MLYLARLSESSFLKSGLDWLASKALITSRNIVDETRGSEPPPEAPYVHRPQLFHPRRAGGVKGGAVQPPSEARAPLTPPSPVVCWAGDGLRSCASGSVS